jgi:recombination protein RecA
MATELGVVEKKGSYYYRGEESLAQGRENAKQYLREHPEVASEIEAVVRERLASESAPLPTADPDERSEVEEEEPALADEL